MLGAIIGDVIGSRFEKENIKSKTFELFTKDSRYTDDTVLTIATADKLINGGDYAQLYRKYAQKHPLAGFGGTFRKWMTGIIDGPYNSWGNGSAMRVSPVGYAFDTEEEVLEEAKISASVTHNHSEGIKGAQAVAMAIFVARKGQSKPEIKTYIEQTFQYDLSQTIEEIRPEYKFDVSCQGSVPQAIIAFLESTDFEDAIRTAISIGGDSDTIACISGAIAEAFYGGIPEELVEQTLARLPKSFKKIIEDFNQIKK
ncbi:MAG: ADP-ribosylglycohydrolase family protein [Bacteroidia bacterium]